MKTQTRYFPPLTGIRAIAAYLVFLYHFPILFISQPVRAQLDIGVGLFFVLSGFLIHYRYADSFNGRRSWWVTYIINRFARIYPLYFILSVVSLVYLSAGSIEWITNLTLTRGFFDSLKFSGAAQGWSLTVEESFYLSAPLLFIMLRRGRFWVPLFSLYGMGLLLVLSGQVITYQRFFGDFEFMAKYTFFGRAFDFFIGMYLSKRFLAGDLPFQNKAHIQAKQAESQGRSNGVSQKNVRYIFLITGMLMIFGTMLVEVFALIPDNRFRALYQLFPLLLALFIVVSPYVPATHRITFIGVSGIILILAFRASLEILGFNWKAPINILINNIIFPIAFATLFLGLLTEKTFVSRFLGSRVMVLLGKSSYAFYLIHYGVISEPILEFIENNIADPLIVYGVHFMVINIVSIAVYRYLEEPVNHFIRSTAVRRIIPVME